MFEKLEKVVDHMEDIGQKLMDPSVISNNQQYASLMREYKNLETIVSKYLEYKNAVKSEADALEILNESGLDKEFKEMVEQELKDSKDNQEKFATELQILLLPSDPNDSKNVIIEIRGGAGGDEAALFANSLFRMYAMYAEQKNWKMEVLNQNITELGGLKEISFSISGEGAYSKLKFESGVHRVQRVPETESQGRVHTSTVTVAVLPEVEDVEVEINPNDLHIDTYRSGGAGGQHVNMTDSAVRIVHVPSGIVVECQDERSQHKNKDKAMKILRSRLYDKMLEEQNKEISDQRRSQVGTGDRSERIRTYNYPQSRVTDHRINLTLYKLDQVLNGDLDEIINGLITADQAAKLEASQDV